MFFDHFPVYVRHFHAPSSSVPECRDEGHGGVHRAGERSGQPGSELVRPQPRAQPCPAGLRMRTGLVELEHRVGMGLGLRQSPGQLWSLTLDSPLTSLPSPVAEAWVLGAKDVIAGCAGRT